MPGPAIAVRAGGPSILAAIRHAAAGRAPVQPVGGDRPALDGALAVVDASGVPEPTDLDEAGADDLVAATRRLLVAASEAGVDRLVLVSSAVVYGARPDGPVPLTEAAPARPEPSSPFAAACAEAERLAAVWAAEDPGRTAAVLRSAPVLGAGPGLASALRPTSPLRGGGEDPPVQFVALADLAAAVVLAALTPLDGPLNVAAPGGLAGADLRALAGVPARLPLPDWLARRLRSLAAPGHGLGPYSRHAFVVATDRLADAGWAATTTNEEAWVATSPGAPWSRLSPRRRQNLILGGAVAAVVAAAAAAVGSIRRA